MKFVLEINTDNDAFQASSIELGEIVRSLGLDLSAFGIDGTDYELKRKVYDSNGNAVGTWQVGEFYQLEHRF